MERAVGGAEMLCDACEAVCCNPAHRARERVHALPPPILPKTRVGRVELLHGPLAQPLQPLEHSKIAARDDPLIEEPLHRGAHDGAIHVVLALLVRLVAYPHGAHAPIPGECRDDALGQTRFAGDAVDGLEIVAHSRR